MRKLLSAALASAMALSLASVAFAATNTIKVVVSDGYYRESSSIVKDQENKNVKIGYGKTAYYVLYKDDANTYLSVADDAKQVKAKAQWTQNGDMVEKVEIVKKRMTDDKKYAYTVAIKVKDKVSTSTTEIAGKIELSAKGSSEIAIEDALSLSFADKVTINPFITVGYDKAAKDATSTTSFTLDDDDLIYEFKGDGVIDDTDTSKNKFAEDEEFEFELYGNAGTFVVDTQGQGKILLSSTVAYNEGLEAIYPDANYVYITGNGKSLNKTGILTLFAEEDTFLYQVKNGKLVKLNAEYDDVEEGFVLKTRTLGTYVISDEELDLELQNKAEEAPASEEGEVTAEPTVPANPETGAAA